MNFLHAKTFWFISLYLLLVCVGCNNTETQNKTPQSGGIKKGTYAYDAAFLKKHTKKTTELINEDSSGKVLLSADYQGRVMTSTAYGDTGTSFGWINYDLIASHANRKQFNPVGGEERFWMGPEGGQYSLYFKTGDSFDFANWYVPGFIDTSSYDVTHTGKNQVVFSKKARLTNYSGTIFDLSIERKITLLNKDRLAEKLQQSIPSDLRFIAYETENKIRNEGNNDWIKEKGLLSIWLLGMFTPTEKTIVIIPFHPFKDARSYITDNYFGSIPAERLKIKDSVLFFTCDGKYRSKIGLSPAIAKPIAASFDFEKNALTIVIPQIDKNAPYVNSKWEIQKQPYKGDVINSYNDGPLEDGSQLGPFYEIESSSPALELKKNQTGVYRQVTCHFQGDYNALRKLARQLLGVDPDELK